jgi:Acyl dehydratase
MTYNEINIGDSASVEKTISENDVYSFAGITGDFNPMHINKRHAEETRFGQRIAHGMLISGLFSTIFGMKMPGEGAIYLSQEVSFKAPVFIGDTIMATATAVEKLEKGRVKFECTAVNQNGDVVISGAALLLAPKE